MRTTNTSRLRGRRGTSTIFGTLIFIAILFSSVIPMFLYMRQADALFEKRKHELNRLDEEQNAENIYVYAHPPIDQPSQLTVKVYNRGDRAVRIVRLWISERTSIDDEPIQIDFVVDSMSEVTLGTYIVSPEEGESYNIKVTTERGNIFASDSSPLRYEGGSWEVDLQLINIIISSSQGVLTIECIGVGGHVYPSPVEIQKGSSGSAFYSFDVSDLDVPDEYETYHIIIRKGTTLIHEEDVTMKWPEGPAVEWVYA